MYSESEKRSNLKQSITTLQHELREVVFCVLVITLKMKKQNEQDSKKKARKWQ